MFVWPICLCGCLWVTIFCLCWPGWLAVCVHMCVHVCACLSGICTQPCYWLDLATGSHSSPTAMGLVDGATVVLVELSSAELQCPLWISWHLTTKMTNQLILLRITLAPLTAGQMGPILKEHIAIVISHRLLSGDSLWSLTTRSEFKLTEYS